MALRPHTDASASPFLARLRTWLCGERGVSMIASLGVLAVFSTATMATVSYSLSNDRHSSISRTEVLAHSLAEAGLNNAMATLSNPSQDALDPTLLPPQTSEYDGGSVTWSGVLSGNTWTLTATGRAANPQGGNLSDSVHTLSVTTVVQSALTQPLNNMAWNYIYATKTGDPDGCDEILSNSVEIDTPMYINGNLCLQNSAAITEGPLVVKGAVYLANSSHIGSSGAPISELHVTQGCKASSNPLHLPCRNGSPSAGDNVWASTITTTPPVIDAPVADFPGWYAATDTINSSSDCTTLVGTPPTFDTNGARDSSVTTIQNLTPSGSYTCRKIVGGTTTAELSWNSSTRTLTVRGVIFIDGSATVANGEINRYNGHGSLYLSGTFVMGNSTKLCAVDNGSNCTFEGWNPNNEMLVIVTGGQGGSAGSGVGISLANSVQLQAALYATYAINLGNSVQVEGPMVASEVIIVNSIDSYDFPFISTVPIGTPGNPNVYAQPQAPTNYIG
jgi:Tfp pilus assembly protein PilX